LICELFTFELITHLRDIYKYIYIDRYTVPDVGNRDGGVGDAVVNDGIDAHRHAIFGQYLKESTINKTV